MTKTALLSTFDGETDIMEVLDRVIEHARSLTRTRRAGTRNARRIEIKATRAIATRIVEALGVSTLSRRIYSPSTYPRKALVTNADELPKEMIREVSRHVAIGKALRAGETIPGAELKNPEPQLTIRTS